MAVWTGAKKRAAVLLGVNQSSATRTFKPFERLARLIASDFTRFLLIFLPYLPGPEVDLSGWPRSRQIAGYDKLSWDQFVLAITPAFQKLRTLWRADDRTALELLASYLHQALPSEEPSHSATGNAHREH